jgi:hypothetical protein
VPHRLAEIDLLLVGDRTGTAAHSRADQRPRDSADATEQRADGSARAGADRSTASGTIFFRAAASGEQKSKDYGDCKSPKA